MWKTQFPVIEIGKAVTVSLIHGQAWSAVAILGLVEPTKYHPLPEACPDGINLPSLL